MKLKLLIKTFCITLSFMSTYGFGQTYQTDDFVTTWKTDIAGTSNNTSITVPTFAGATYNYAVDWDNDGVFEETGITGDVTHDYRTVGTYTIRIRGLFPQIYFNKRGDKEKILAVTQWGKNPWTSMDSAFSGCSNFNGGASDVPNLSNLTSLFGMFAEATSYNQPINGWDVSSVTNMEYMFNIASSFNQPLNDWNVSSVTSMSAMFSGASSFNQPLNDWNVSSVTSMDAMFYELSTFNQPLNDWDVSNVTDMGHMFIGASTFNQLLNDWDVSNVTFMGGMFVGASSFNQPLNDWDVSNVTSMGFMFYEASSFNQSLSNWDVGSVEYMEYMFFSASSFNQPLNDWNVSSVTYMYNMFRDASSFNQPLDGWNVNSVTIMSAMFYGASTFNQPLDSWNVDNVADMGFMFFSASSFNQPLNNWNVSNVGNMSDMFYEASSFNQPLNDWDLSRVYNIENMLDNTGLTTTNYDAILTGWRDNTNTPDNLTLGAVGLEYCVAENDRQYLIDTKSWTITGDNKDCTSLSTVDDILPNGLKLYPNPTTRYITVEGLENIIRSTIYTIQGQKIKEKIENNKINLENVPAGMYLLKIETEKGIVIKKIIKK